jgi:NAD-dependent deacetylase
VPILISADGPKGLAVAAELGDGVFSAALPQPDAAGVTDWRALLSFGTVLDENTGAWEGRPLMDVASEHGWRTHPRLVLDFYNARRREISAAKPNAAHYGLAALQDDFDVHIVTTNIDDLHERAGSTRVIHLHGNIMKMRSEKVCHTRLYDIAGDMHLGDVAEDAVSSCPTSSGSANPCPRSHPPRLWRHRPDIFVVIGTTLSVYPAAGLADYVRPETPKFVIDNMASTSISQIDSLTPAARPLRRPPRQSAT